MPPKIEVLGKMEDGFHEILTPQAMSFVGNLVTRFTPTLEVRLRNRNFRQRSYDVGNMPDTSVWTAGIRNSNWKVNPLPDDLLERKVEITGPVERKMVINALNSGANVFMADFEDSNSPTWHNIIQGQINLRDAVNGDITFQRRNKHYKLNEHTATLMVRPRGLHLPEKHILVDGKRTPASLVDFGLYFFHNAQNLIDKGSGPYFYLPKLEHDEEARWWNNVFIAAQDELGIKRGTIKATVLLETFPAAFRMEEILYRLKEHSAGLNCGRWDYIFSYIKTHREHADKLVPDRDEVGMNQPFMDAYTSKVISICHKREAHAMGGMAAQIPIKNDEEANEAAINKVRLDKVKEVEKGHDGTWVAHPHLVGLAMEIFDHHLRDEAHQIYKQVDASEIYSNELSQVPEGNFTYSGFKKNVAVGVEYLAHWLNGNGCVAIDHKMEDAATAEISRTQVWQWLRHHVTLQDGREVNHDMYDATLKKVIPEIEERNPDLPEEHITKAAELFTAGATKSRLSDFLTTSAYEVLQ
jgi:malate synthase